VVGENGTVPFAPDGNRVHCKELVDRGFFKPYSSMAAMPCGFGLVARFCR
jgi:hypothetical protein